jgi:arsenate reductase-like glutaredoxin family protein
MNAITSICIPRIESVFNAEFIADVFDRNGIAQVSRVYIEPYKSSIKNGYNRAYIAINAWYSTDSAYNFMNRLLNRNREARIIYSDDNWWPVDINKYPNKLASNKRVLTVFEEKQNDFYSDDISTTAMSNDKLKEFVQVNPKKTELLRSIVASFNQPLDNLNQLQDDDVYAFDDYLREMYNEREKWFSEQYIYDELDM